VDPACDELLDHEERRLMLNRRTRNHGVTLIELMVGVAIMIILLFLALPNFAIWMQNTQIRTGGEAILNGLQLARAEAVRRNTSVRFQLVDSLTSSCALSATGGNWVVSLADPSGACEVAASDTVAPQIVQKKSGAEGSPNAVVTVAPAGATIVTFSGLGSVAVKNEDGSDPITEMKIDSGAIPAADSRELCIMVNLAGAVRLCDPQVAAGDSRACLPAVPAGCL
jgi:type IV fimbrial biogenesis protein FimT